MGNLPWLWEERVAESGGLTVKRERPGCLVDEYCQQKPFAFSPSLKTRLK
jgi:hypothetical protein